MCLITLKISSKGFTRNYGRITFTNALDKGKSVIITYNKAPELLQAQDRINLILQSQQQECMEMIQDSYLMVLIMVELK